MWRNEVGIMEMLIAYLTENEEVTGWTNWRGILIDILSCHEEMKRNQHASDIIDSKVIETKAELDTLENNDFEVNEGWKGLEGIASNYAQQENSPEYDAKAETEYDRNFEIGLAAANVDKEEVFDLTNEMDEEEIAPLSDPDPTRIDPTIMNLQLNQKKRIRSVLARPLGYSLGRLAKPFCCSFCSSTFSTRYLKARHERVHTGEKPYACRFCEKTFSDYSNTKAHERIHTGEKPYTCRYCRNTYRTSSDKNKHERTHTGEKPFACQFCHKKFTSSSHKLSHERVHTMGSPSDPQPSMA